MSAAPLSRGSMNLFKSTFTVAALFCLFSPPSGFAAPVYSGVWRVRLTQTEDDGCAVGLREIRRITIAEQGKTVLLTDRWVSKRNLRGPRARFMLPGDIRVPGFRVSRKITSLEGELEVTYEFYRLPDSQKYHVGLTFYKTFSEGGSCWSGFGGTAKKLEIAQ